MCWFFVQKKFEYFFVKNDLFNCSYVILSIDFDMSVFFDFNKCFKLYQYSCVELVQGERELGKYQ